MSSAINYRPLSVKPLVCDSSQGQNSKHLEPVQQPASAHRPLQTSSLAVVPLVYSC